MGENVSLARSEMAEQPQVLEQLLLESASAIAEAEKLPAHLPHAERRALVRGIYAASDPASDRFRPFARPERQRLRAAYEADLGRIDRDHPEAILSFDPHELAT